LELALTTTNEALMVFERFMELIMPPGSELFERIVYIPGNHDHHLWEIARETQYVEYLETLEPGKRLNIPWHTTRLFIEEATEQVPMYLLTKLVQRYPHLRKSGFAVHTAYPNLGLYREDGSKCVIFHHGHYIEPLYQLMSGLKNLLFPERELPGQVWEIEAENFAWIDFFWSTMGRSGEAGQDIERIYEKMQDRDELKKLLAALAAGLAKRYDLPGWGDAMETKLLEWVLNRLADKFSGRERNFTERALSPDTEKGLWAYAKGPLREQILRERDENMPDEVTLVFGHTHKPFQEDLNFRGYPQWVSVYNTGGWVVDTVEPEPLHGGAVVLVDEALNAVSLRMYSEEKDPGRYAVRVEQAAHPGEEPNPLYRQIASMVRAQDEPWRTFSMLAARTVSKRAQNLRARIHDEG
jgi:hypothetical protein